MRNLVKENPQGNYEYIHNLTTVKDNEVYIRDYDDMGDLSLRDYCSEFCKRKCGRVIDVSLEEFGEYMDCDCVVSMFYWMAVGHAELRLHLKAYENTGRDPEEIEELANENKVLRSLNKAVDRDNKLLRREKDRAYVKLEKLFEQNRDLVELLKIAKKEAILNHNYVFANCIDKALEKSEGGFEDNE
jgi:hypothetical protein